LGKAFGGTFDKEHDMIDLIHGDCMEYMKDLPDKYFDLAIVDPPYGIGFDGHHTITKEGHKGFSAKKELHVKKDWDNQRPSAKYFTELQRISKNQIIWGGNYFADLLPVSRGWIFWDKKITNANNTNFSDGELAWTSFNGILRRFTYDWIGFGYLNNPQREKKIHPTQKPVQLYRWINDTYATPNMKIIDTHLGSGSSAIAAFDGGFDFVGIEIDKEYFDAASSRFANHKLQLKLF